MAEIKGTNSNDNLIGTILNDHMYGFKGNDILDGGAGRDELEGGSGADRYVFSSQSHSPNKGPGVNGDTIIGFNGDEGDKIDLSKIDAHDFTFVDLPIGIDLPVFLNGTFKVSHSESQSNETFNVNQLSYSDGVLHADVINGPDVEITLAGAPPLNILTDVIL